MASTMGHARGSTQGSWRPLPRSLVSTPPRVTVSCSLLMVDVHVEADLVAHHYM